MEQGESAGRWVGRMATAAVADREEGRAARLTGASAPVSCITASPTPCYLWPVACQYTVFDTVFEAPLLAVIAAE